MGISLLRILIIVIRLNVHRKIIFSFVLVIRDTITYHSNSIINYCFRGLNFKKRLGKIFLYYQILISMMRRNVWESY